MPNLHILGIQIRSVIYMWAIIYVELTLPLKYALKAMMIPGAIRATTTVKVMSQPIASAHAG